MYTQVRALLVRALREKREVLQSRRYYIALRAHTDARSVRIIIRIYVRIRAQFIIIKRAQCVEVRAAFKPARLCAATSHLPHREMRVLLADTSSRLFFLLTRKFFARQVLLTLADIYSRMRKRVPCGNTCSWRVRLERRSRWQIDFLQIEKNPSVIITKARLLLSSRQQLLLQLFLIVCHLHKHVLSEIQ